jgi:hypothetical protein
VATALRCSPPAGKPNPLTRTPWQGDWLRSSGVTRDAVVLASKVGDAKRSLGDAKSSLGDAKSSLGDAKSSLGDAKSSLGDAKSSLGDV